MQMPTPVLIRIEYKKKEGELSPDGLLPVRKLVELDPEDCTLPCSLDGNEEWTIYSHLRIKGRKGVQFALKLPAPAQAYQITISPTADDAGEALLRYNQENWVYFYIPTKFGEDERKKKHGKTEYIPLPGLAEYIASAGQQFICISCGGESLKPIRLRILPSGFSEKEYAAILRDIALLQRQLLIGNTGAVSIEERWSAKALDVEEQTAKMERILRQLEAAPDQNLVAVRSRQPAYKLKKFTPKALADLAAGKRLLRTEIHEESLNIYEHRAIRRYLENLKKLTEQYQELEQAEREALAGEPIIQDVLREAETVWNQHIEMLIEKMQAEDLSQKSKRPYFNETKLCLQVRGEPCLQQETFHSYEKLLVSSEQKISFDATRQEDNIHFRFAQLAIHIKDNWRQVLFFQQCIR